MGKIHSAVLKTHFYAEKSEQRTNAHRPRTSLYVENRRWGQSVPTVQFCRSQAWATLTHTSTESSRRLRRRRTERKKREDGTMGRSALSPSSLWQSHKRLSSLTPAWSGRSIHPYSTNSYRLSIFCPSVLLPPPLKFAVDDESPARPLASLFILPSHVIRYPIENGE